MANLSQNYTLSKVINEIKLLTRKLGSNSKILQPDLINMINRNTLRIAAMMSNAQDPYYQQKVTVNSISEKMTNVLAEAVYTNSTKNIYKLSHGLDSGDVGKQILIEYDIPTPVTSFLAISEIVSITDNNNFVIKDSLGFNCDPIVYGVLSFSLAETIDISSYKVDTIIKLMDSVNGEIGLVGDSTIEYIASMDESANSVFYNQVGHSLELKRGSNVSGLGTLTLHYYRIPNLASALTDKIDLSDKYIPLLIDTCKYEVYEILGAPAPQDLINKTSALREAEATRQKGIAVAQE